MSQPVKECRSETLITEYLCPSLKLQVGGGYHRAGEVAAGAELEESLTPCWSEGDKADLIQDNQLVTLKLLLQPAQALLVLGLAEFIDESSSGVEPDLPALLASQKPQANGKVSLTGACVANSDDILPGPDIFPLSEIQHPGLREGSNGRKVELVQGSEVREAGS